MWLSFITPSANILAPLLLLLTSFLPSHTSAYSFVTLPSPNLDLGNLGRVALAGNYDSLSLYRWLGQNENGAGTNGSQALLGRYPDGSFANIAVADASIRAMCPFTYRNGTLIGVVVGGNFTSLHGEAATAIALFNPTSGEITPLPGLSGQVNALYCDNASETVYIGGSFTGAASTNAIAWTTGWTNLPFAGFNGPVTSIAKLANGNIAFGGSFTGIANSTAPAATNAQAINVGAAGITTIGSTANVEYSNPRNIICRTPNDTNTQAWLLADDTPGSWQAAFEFGIYPSKLRLYNSQVPGYATKTWRFTVAPNGGILNFTYTDPATGKLSSCTSQCPLPNNNATYQDYYFVNVIGMSAFSIDISDWYGNGAGLGGIELFQNAIYSYAINSFNEAPCDGVSNGSSSAAYGPWTINSTDTTSQYLETTLASGTLNNPNASVVFMPDIKQSGNYSVLLYTPGCMPDNSCSTRALVNVTGRMQNSSATSFSFLSYQTNYEDKIEVIYTGYIEANSAAFRPTVTLAPTAGQRGPLKVVAQQLQFELRGTSAGGLNGLYEFNPNLATISSDYSASAIDAAGIALTGGASVNALQVANGVTYVGGAFTGSSANNVLSVGSGSGAGVNTGLNNAVDALYLNGSLLYAGGSFTNTYNNNATGLNYVAVYSLVNHTWSPLGAGVNGMVLNVIPLSINISANNPTPVIAVSGYFTQVNAFGSNAAYPVNNIAVWVPSKGDWLHNLGTSTISISGRLTAGTNVPGMDPLYAGSINSQALGAGGISTLGAGNSNADLESLPINILPQRSTTLTPTRKRAAAQQEVFGVVTGLFYAANNLNITVLGGHFSAQATNGSTVENLAFINASNHNTVTGLTYNATADAAILALSTSGTTLFAGGSIPNAVLSYDLVRAQLTTNQPPALSGGQALVNAIAAQPSSTAVYVGGSFTSAGSLSCPNLCVWDTSAQQWSAPTPGLSQGSIITALTWASSTRLIVAGNLTLNGNYTTMANYDAHAQAFTPFASADASSALPGPITAFTATNAGYSTFFAAGIATVNNTAFLSKYDGTSWSVVNGSLGSATRIEGLQVLDTKNSHAQTSVLNSNQVLLVTGQLELPGFGNASAALYNGTTFTPYVLSSMADGTPGTIKTAFVGNPQNVLSGNSRPLAVGYVVLIGLAIALALIFLLVVLGIFAERLRRRREGYVLANSTIPQNNAAAMDEKQAQTFRAGTPLGSGEDGVPQRLTLNLR